MVSEPELTPGEGADYSGELPGPAANRTAETAVYGLESLSDTRFFLPQSPPMSLSSSALSCWSADSAGNG